MLKKLFRYEFKYYLKWILISYITLASFLLIARFSYEINELAVEIEEGISFFTFTPTILLIIGAFLVIQGVVLLPMVMCAVRSYRNFVTDEAYLTFTLPVPTKHHILVKTVTPCVYASLSVVVSFLLVTPILCLGTPIQLRDVWETLGLLANELASGFSAYTVITLLLFGVISLISQIIMINFAVAIGQTAKKHKLVGAIVAYLITSGIISFVTGFINNIVFIINMNKDSVDPIFLVHSVNIQSVLLLIIIVFQYWYTLRSFKYKLNLQ